MQFENNSGGFKKPGDLGPVSFQKPSGKNHFHTPGPLTMGADELKKIAQGKADGGKGSAWDEYPLNKAVITIGRDRSCDIVVNHPGISSLHSRITCSNGYYMLVDCNSAAGTYVNGNRLRDAKRLIEGDHIALGAVNYVYSRGKLIYAKMDDPRVRGSHLGAVPTPKRPVVLRADIKTKQVKNNSGRGMKELIRDIHLEVKEGSLVAMLGTAGAGKSTVMNCMNGMDLQGVQGRVLYRNVDLVHNFEQMKHLIGSVPQKKTFHDTFTPEQEFEYAARLRLPADISNAEIKERVGKTLEMLSITNVRKTRNSKLSGGEQTRVNMGIELVADRDLLCLDEPDQGLSPNFKREVFEILQELAHKHCKTVICIIHDVSEIDMFDQVIILAKDNSVGRLAFSGTPAFAREHFGCEIKDAYALLGKEPGQWIRKWDELGRVGHNVL